MTSTLIPNAFQSPNDYVDIGMELLTPEEFKCLMFAVRHILGWQDKINKRRGVISLTMFEHGYITADGTRFGGTGLGRATLLNATDALARSGLVVKVGQPTEDGQEWELDSAVDWDYLRNRKAERDAINQQRTEKARQTRAANKAGLSHKPVVVSPTNQLAVCATNQQVVSPTDQYRSVPQTGAGLSDKLNQNHDQNHDQNRTNKEQQLEPPPVPRIYGIYVENMRQQITPIVRDALVAAVTEFGESWVEDAVKEAVLHNAKTWAYVQSVLDRWGKEGRDKRRASTDRGESVKANSKAAPVPNHEFVPTKDVSAGIPESTWEGFDAWKAKAVSGQ